VEYWLQNILFLGQENETNQLEAKFPPKRRFFGFFSVHLNFGFLSEYSIKEIYCPVPWISKTRYKKAQKASKS
jgi:hypothetical protein